MNRETETERREQLQRELEAEAREKHEQAARLKQKEVISPNSQRRKAEDSAKADRYCNKDGGKPDLDALAQLDRFEYGQVRKETAARSGVTVAILDSEVSDRRRRSSGRSAEREYWTVESADRPVDGKNLLKQLIGTIRAYVMMTADQGLTVALWVIFSWMHDAAVHSPILLVSSPEPDCGKTTLLGLVQLLTPRGLIFVEASPAVIYRMIECWHPTLIVDEADSAFQNNPELRAVINSGWTRGAGVPRCNPDTNEPEFFETFGPKAIGLKGLGVPATTLGRSIIVELQRKLPTDGVTDFDHTDTPALAALRSALARFAQDRAAALGQARPEQPENFHNRVAANWRLMFAIADHCGVGKEARAAAVKLSGRADEASLGVELLRDIRDLFERLRTDRITSEHIVKELGNMLDRPWCEMPGKGPGNGKPITQRGLASLLKAYRTEEGNPVKPKQVRFDAVTLKGYLLESFEKAFRYIPRETPENKRNSETTAENGQNIRNKSELRCFG